MSISGCSKGTSTSRYCNGANGPLIGQAQSITLQPTVGGLSLGFSQTASVTTPTAVDCQNNTVTIASYKYSTTNPSNPAAVAVADVNPTTGALCAGQWNRNNASGVPDYTFCTSTGQAGIAELTAAGSGANSNKVLVYVHPQITAISLGAPSTDCTNDPASNCPQYTATATTTAAPYVPNSCISFNQSQQLVARFFAGKSNITYSAGHATFAAQTAGLVTIENTSGVATALAPGTTVVTATIANSTSTAGMVSVCPPKSITITTPNTANGSVTVNPNNTEPFTARVLDTQGNQITGLTLTFNSTNPIAVPASSTGITPAFPGGAAVTAFCLPPSCNPSPYGNVGLQGTGKPISSNTIVSTTPGSNSTRLWIGSTDSIYLVPVDLTTGVVPSPTRLPYTPNSMIISQNGATIFMGSPQALMTFATGGTTGNGGGVTTTNVALQGTVLAVSPDSTTVVISDPNRQTITLYNSATPAVTSTFGGVGTRAAFTPDGTTLYVTTTDNHLLVYSSFTSWQSYDLSATGANDVTVAVPSVGAFVGGNTAVNGRSYCANSNVTPTIFYPQASSTTVAAAVCDPLAGPKPGQHLQAVRLPGNGGSPIVDDLTFSGSNANDGTAGTRTFTTTLPSGDCPESGNPPTFGTVVNTAALTSVVTPNLTGIYPASDSTIAFATYLPTASATSQGALLPAYTPAASGAGTVQNVTLATGATAPVTGVFSQDNKFFFTGTSGDNQVHIITRSTLTDGSQLAPKLPSNSGANYATPNLLVQYPRSVTNN